MSLLPIASAAACAAVAVLVVAARPAPRSAEGRRRPRPPRLLGEAGRGRVRLPAAAIVTGGAILLPLAQRLDLAHVLAGIVAAACTSRWMRRTRRDRPPPARDLDEYALLVDLLAACLCAGAPLPAALRAVAAGSEGRVARAFGEAAARWSLGADVDEVAAGLEAVSPVLRPLAGVLAQAESGAGLAAGVQRLAADARRERRWRLLAAARAVGTRSALPLTLCFLPAFLLVSVVPLLAATATRLLS